MRKTIELYDGYELPAKYEVCWRCEGEGKHVNPAIDGNGLTASDIQELEYDDPEFLDNYMGGMYDVACHECKGQRVVLVVDEDQCTPEELEEYRAYEQDKYEAAAMYRAEMRVCGDY